MPPPLPQGLKSNLTATLTLRITPQEGFNEVINVSLGSNNVAPLDLHFSFDFKAVMIGRGWPSVTFDNSAPLRPATAKLVVTFLEAGLGTFDPQTGHMDLPVKLHLNYTPDPFLARRDQDVDLTLTTRFSGERLWENMSFPSLGMRAQTAYETTNFLGWGKFAHRLAVLLDGKLSPLPPRPGTPPPTEHPDCAKIRADISARHDQIEQLYQALEGLNPRNRTDRRAINQINSDISKIREETSNLQRQAASLGCR